MPPQILLAYESGYGLGHLVRLSEIARRVRARGANAILASFRLDDVDRVADSFDMVLQAPVWPMLFATEKTQVATSGPSFATALTNMGFAVARYVAANQRAWRVLMEQLQIDVVVADYAPGAILAAKGFCPSIDVGTPFSTAVLDNEIYPPFLPELETDGTLEPQIFAAICEAMAMARVRRPAPARLSEALIGDQCLPMGFPEFDPYHRQRREPLLLPNIGPVASASRREGSAVYCYLPDWMQHGDVLMASLCALKLPVRLFMPNVAAPLLADLQRYGVELSPTPFSIKELARSARVFLHHGGFGSCHFGLVAGVPQIAIVSDMEKAVNGRALTTLGAGRTVDYSRLTLPHLRQQANEIFSDDDLHRHAAELGATMRARLTGPDPIDIAAERVLAAAA